LENLDAACEDYSILKSFIEQGKISDTSIQNEITNAIQDICIESKPSYYYQRGIGYYNLKEFSKALEIYSKGLEKFPNHSMMLSFKGNAYLALNEFQKAIDFYDLSLNYKDKIQSEIKTNPNLNAKSGSEMQEFIDGTITSTYYSRSECKLNLGKYGEALADIHTAIKLAPEIESFNKEVYYNLRGYTYMAMGKYDEAIADFNKSIAINKNFPLAYVNRAVASVSKVEKPTTTNFTINSTLNNQPSNILWSAPKKSAVRKQEIKLLEAINDCNSAIQIEKNLGYAFYIRGQIKQMLKHNDFCMDLFSAQSFGVEVEEELLINCNK
jgi:tetratricopeptide (TPR) repeat protein